MRMGVELSFGSLVLGWGSSVAPIVSGKVEDLLLHSCVTLGPRFVVVACIVVVLPVILIVFV